MNRNEAETLQNKQEAKDQTPRVESPAAEFAALLGELQDPFSPGMAGRRTGQQRAIQLRRRYGPERFRQMLRKAWTQRKGKRNQAGLQTTQTVRLSSQVPTAQMAAGGKGGRPPVLRIGEAFPRGVEFTLFKVDAGQVVSLASSAAYASAGGFANDADFATQLVDPINALNPTDKSADFSFTETKGLNMNWSGKISLSMVNDTVAGPGGAGEVTSQTGGSTTVSGEKSKSTTQGTKVTTGAETSASAGGKVEGADVSVGGKQSVGTESSTSTTTGSKDTKTGTDASSASIKAQESMEHHKADINASVSVSGEPDFSGTDYINPFKWGSAAATEVMVNGSQRREGVAGKLEYNLRTGFAPAQKKGWVEHELGERVLTKDEVRKLDSVDQIDPRNFSRDGARQLPPALARPAEEHHGTSLEGVRLVQGAQADTYCNQMDAAAFCTPSAEGQSDIYVHSGISLNTPEGQHTVQHEIAHAVQNQRGETQELSGLGGDPAKRDQLESAADSHADEVLTASGPAQRKQDESADGGR